MVKLHKSSAEALAWVGEHQKVVDSETIKVIQKHNDLYLIFQISSKYDYWFVWKPTAIQLDIMPTITTYYMELQAKKHYGITEVKK